MRALLKLGLPLLVLVIAVLMAWWLLHQKPPSATTLTVPEFRADRGVSQSDQPVTTVKVRAKAYKAGVWPFSFVFNGVVKPSKQVALVTEVNGTVQYVSPKLKNGGLIQKGDALITLLSPGLSAQKASAQSRVLQASQKLQELKAQIESAGVVPGLKTPSEYRKSLVLAQQSVLNAANEELRAVQDQVAKQSVKAPFNGMFVGDLVSEGQALIQGFELGQFYSPADLKVEFGVNAKDLNELMPEQSTVIHDAHEMNDINGIKDIDAVVAKALGTQYAFYTAQLFSPLGKLDMTTGLSTLKLKLEPEAGTVDGLVPGERVLARLTRQSKQPLLKLPLGAVRGNEVMAVRLDSPPRAGAKRSTSALPLTGKIVRFRVKPVRADEDYAYYEARQGQVLYLVKSSLLGLRAGQKVSVELLEQGA